jgi:hypothetical protein
MVMRTYRKSPATIFIGCAKSVGITHAELAKRLGYNSDPSAAWIAAGKMPHTAALACQAIAGAQGSPCDSVLVVKPDDKLETLKTILYAMNINFTEL